MAFERPRGVRDFNPPEMCVRTYVEDAICSAFESFSYRRIQTPTFEFLELFDMKSGQDIKEHLYVLEDKGGRKLCLRPEATASVARMYASDLRSRPKPLRLYYLGPMFRYEEPQKGRYREFWQAGVELLGASGYEADAEVVCLASDCLRALGLKSKIRISHIGVLRRLLGIQGFDGSKQDRLIQALDKGDFEAVKAQVSDQSFIRLLEVKGGEAALDESIGIVSDQEARNMLQELKRTLTLLDAAGVEYEVDFSMARGLDYYTGMVFDARVEGLGAQNQVAGGGRYDDLISLFKGPQTPAVGFAFGLDRLLESMQKQGAKLPQLETDVVVVAASEDVRDAAFNVAADLRRRLVGKVVEYDLSGRKLNKALQHASENNVRYAVIIGSSELAEESVVLKDMAAQTQSKVRLQELPQRIN
jgi:histidyl-tRNA synthetase